jgi:hypothetical protein
MRASVVAAIWWGQVAGFELRSANPARPWLA